MLSAAVEKKQTNTDIYLFYNKFGELSKKKLDGKWHPLEPF